MKRTFIFIIMTLAFITTASAITKIIKVRTFQEAPENDLSSRRAQHKVVVAGDTLVCPLVKVRFNKPNAEFEGSIPMDFKPEYKTNEYWVFMNPGAQRLTIKHPDYRLVQVEFGQYKKNNTSTRGLWKLEENKVYILELEPEDEVTSSFTVGAGFNVMPFMGPTVNVGFKLKKFSVEGGAVLGLSKSSEVYIYDKSSKLVDGYNYSALRAFLRVGYDILNVSSDVFSITPQAGAAFNTINGSQLSEISGSGDKVLDGASAISGTVGLRFMYAPSGVKGPLRIFVTPEYDFALSKDKNFEALSAFDSKIKSWAEGLNVNLGLLFYF